jgi:hypothetical protein
MLQFLLGVQKMPLTPEEVKDLENALSFLDAGYTPWREKELFYKAAREYLRLVKGEMNQPAVASAN